VIQSVERAIDILNAVASRGDWVGVRQVARLTGLKVPTAQQLLKTLQARSFLAFDRKRRQYRIGVGVLLLARAVDPADRLGDLVRPHVERLFAAFGETVLALTLDRGRFVVLASRPSDHQLSVRPPDAGETVERPWSLATGRVLLAGQPEDARRRDAGAGPTRQELGRIRRAGFARTIDVDRSGVAALAVPVRSPHGPPAMALGCSVPASRYTEALGARLLRALKAEAGRVERELGGRS
jgi:IclR family acetate operon transcriptional repressor